MVQKKFKIIFIIFIQVGGIEDYTDGKGWSKRSAGLQFQRYFYGGCEVPESEVKC